MVEKEELIKEIKEAFKDVRLEDGIGLWEAQGYDDRLSSLECKKLRAKDETNDWGKISIIDMYECNSSITFFDAKGMLFHIPKYLLIALDVYKSEEKKLIAEGSIEEFYKPDIADHLVSITRYLCNKNDSQYKEFYKRYFSLFNNKQLKCLVKFLKYKMNEIEEYYKSDAAKKLGVLPAAVEYDSNYIQLQEAIVCWTNEYQIK